MADKRMRVGIIGDTPRGKYGHGLDVCWKEIPDCEIVGVADPDEAGRAAAVKKLGSPQSFANYEEMMDAAKPEIVAICPRHADQHRDMFLAAARRGIHVYVEKPMCRDLVEADEMAAACEEHGVKLAVAHLTRYSPTLDVVREEIADGRIGDLLEIRARGKEDRRGGAEDLWVLGSHMLNVMHFLAGEPRWCFGRLEADGRAAVARDVVDGAEGLGPLAGNGAHAVYGFDKGVKGFFGSVQGKEAPGAGRYGLQVFGSEGIIDLHEGYAPVVRMLEEPTWCAAESGKGWAPVTSEGVGKKETLPEDWRLAGNVAAAKDLMQAIRDDRQPECSVYEGRWTVEMILGVFASHVARRPVELPLKLRENALAGW